MLVISPLTSIIANQVTSFRTKGVTAAYAGDEDVAIKKAIKGGETSAGFYIYRIFILYFGIEKSFVHKCLSYQSCGCRC